MKKKDDAWKNVSDIQMFFCVTGAITSPFIAFSLYFIFKDEFDPLKRILAKCFLCGAYVGLFFYAFAIGYLRGVFS